MFYFHNKGTESHYDPINSGACQLVVCKAYLGDSQKLLWVTQQFLLQKLQTTSSCGLWGCCWVSPGDSLSAKSCNIQPAGMTLKESWKVRGDRSKGRSHLLVLEGMPSPCPSAALSSRLLHAITVLLTCPPAESWAGSRGHRSHTALFCFDSNIINFPVWHSGSCRDTDVLIYTCSEMD